MNYEINGNTIKIYGANGFCADKTFDCGQCFRFEKSEDGAWEGIAFSHLISVKEDGDTITLSLLDGAPADERLISYLALDRDYESFDRDILSCTQGDETMKRAIETGKGIRIMRQEPFETLISFIVSQNNNIPRIKKIIARLCAAFGEEIHDRRGELVGYSFPTAKALLSAGGERIRECGTGFRDKYIYDAARAVECGEIDLYALREKSTEEAIAALMKIKGVGPKVAACVALFSLDCPDAFPIDVWVKRVMGKYYKEDFDYHSFGDYAGLAQQYLFYYERFLGGEG